MTHMNAGTAATSTGSLTKVAAALAAAAVVQLVVMEAAGVHGPIWITHGVLAAAAAGVAWRAGGTTRRNPLAFGALIVATVLVVAFVGNAIAQA